MHMLKMVNESTGSILLPKWQIAIAIGATASLGLGYWYLRQHATDKKAALINKLNSVSIDDVTQDQPTKEETPLEKAQRLKGEGNGMFKKGKFEDAIDLYQQAIDACPVGSNTDLATFYQNKAAANEQLKRWPQVIDDCSKALELNEKYEKALYRRAKAYEIQAKWENCLEDITAVCLIQGFQNPNSLQMADRALKELGRIHAQEAMKTKKPMLTSKQFIKTYMLSFSDDPVYKLLTNGEKPPADGDLKGFLRAKMHYVKEEFDMIIAACTEEIESSEAEGGYHFEALSLRATFYLLSGAQKESMEDMTTIIANKDVDVKIKVNSLIRRASLHMQLADMEACMKDFEVAAQLGPEIADVYHHRGQINLLMERTVEAKEDFAMAVKLNPNFAIAVVQKYYADYRSALARQDVQALMENLRDFRKAIVKFKDFSEAYVLFGQVLAERQEFAEADKMYESALSVDPENATILVHRGMLELQWHGNVEKGVEYMQKAIRLDDRCGFAYETLATVEVQRGNLVLAVDLFNKAIELARTEIEMTHLFSLRDAAVAQLKICTRLNIGPALGMQQQ